MGRRWVYLPLVALLGAAAAVLPAVASSETSPTVSAVEGGSCGYSLYCWSPSAVSVMGGASVAFQSPSMSVPHGIVWHSIPAGASSPSCEASVPVHATVNGEGKTNWKGNCTFSQVGTYVLYCSVHGSEMTGSITVNANGTTTTTTTTTTGGTTTTTPTTTTPLPAPESPLVGPASQALKLAKSQRGGVVKGSIDISKAGAGDSLEVDVFAANASLARTKHRGRVRVGRLIRSSVPAGPSSFSVKLAPKARRALKHRKHLALTVKVRIAPLYGEPTAITRSVIEHA